MGDAHEEAETGEPVFVFCLYTVNSDELFVRGVDIMDRSTSRPLVTRAIVVDFIPLLIEEGNSESTVIVGLGLHSPDRPLLIKHNCLVVLVVFEFATVLKDWRLRVVRQCAANPG